MSELNGSAEFRRASRAKADAMASIDVAALRDEVKALQAKMNASEQQRLATVPPAPQPISITWPAMTAETVAMLSTQILTLPIVDALIDRLGAAIAKAMPAGEKRGGVKLEFERDQFGNMKPGTVRFVPE